MSVCALCARPGGSAGVPAVFFPVIVALRSTLRTSPNPRLSTPFRVQRKPPADAQSNNNSATTDKPLLELGGGALGSRLVQLHSALRKNDAVKCLVVVMGGLGANSTVVLCLRGLGLSVKTTWLCRTQRWPGSHCMLCPPPSENCHTENKARVRP